MILNLTDNKKSDIKFEISKFPDGQQSITLTTTRHGSLDSLTFNDTVEIKARLNSFRDLEIIICATRALRNLGVERISLYVPFFLGGRSDRKFGKGGINYIKDVIAPIINLQKYIRVVVTDPHSDVIEACIDNFEKLDNVKLVEYALHDLYPENIPGNSGMYYKKDADYVLISPDAGALKKVFHVAERVGYKKDVIIASKHRDIPTGKITHTDVPIPDQSLLSKDMIIIDDVCDGGRTFNEIAKVIRRMNFTGKIYLIVTHGIFSAGYDELSQYFTGIYCTNSVKNITREKMELEKGNPFYIKQLNVF